MVENKFEQGQQVTPTVVPVVLPDDQPQVLPASSSSESRMAESYSTHDRMVASGTTGAVLGFLFGGPILSALLGFGAAYATKKNGAPGDAARALGDVGLTVREKAMEVDEKHRVVEKTTKVATDVWENAKQYDQKHNVLEKSKDFTVACWVSFVNFVQERRVLQRGVEGVGRGYEFVANKLNCGQDTTTTTTTSNGSSTTNEPPTPPTKTEEQ